MYLKALEIQGFKSFADKTRLTFEKDITSIVGPNGSGKSNISDAILWVLGEQRSKTLRGGKMEDVIFGGTEKRPKMGFAQVSLVLDNTKRIFNTDSTEVMITRRYYRSGESEYYINRESVRLKDISEMLMDTGLGRDGYSVIGQGKISEVVSSKSLDRRELFEEAAGISRYRYRKDESERKLMHTDENLVRINDKIDELKISLDPLKVQAETAKKYLLLRDELRGLEVSVWMETLDRLHERAKTVNDDWENAKNGFERAQFELNELYAASENYSEKMREKDLEAEKRRADLAETETGCAENESELAVLENSLKHNSERKGQLQSEIEDQDTRAKALENQIAKRHERIDEIKCELDELESKARELTDIIERNSEGEDGAKLEISKLITDKSEKQAALAHSNAVLSMLLDAAGELLETDEKRRRESGETLTRRDELLERFKEASTAQKEAKEKADELKNIIEGYTMRMEGRESKVKALEEKQTKLTIDLNSARSRVSMLTEMEKEFEGFSLAVKTVMREHDRGTLSGVHGPVANLVKTDDRFTIAIETALGASMQSIVVDTQEQGKSAIEMLKRRDAGRATFLPVDTIKSFDMKRRPENENGYLGTAFELVRFDPKFAGIFSNLLSRTVITETLSDAVAMSKHNDNQLRIVTLDGQLINAGGSMTGGSAAKNSGILSRANELKTLNLKVTDLSELARDCASKLSDASRELNSAKYELQTAEFEQKEALETLRSCDSEKTQVQFLLNETEKTLETLERDEKLSALRREENTKRAESAKNEIGQLNLDVAGLELKLTELSARSEEHEIKARELSEKLSAFAEKRSSLVSESDTTLIAIKQLEELLSDLTGDGETRRQAIGALSAENEELGQKKQDAEDALSKNRLTADNIRGEITQINSLKLELEGKRTQNEKKTQEVNRELLDMERLCGSIEQKKLASEMEEKQIIDKLWDGYELSRTAAQSIREPVPNMGEATKRITSLKREITGLGNPNIGAIEEYERISERYNFLSEQRDDVEKAKRELEKIIGEITKEMQEIFLREFKIIDESFRNTFLELFGGGRAALILDDEEDILNCGIEIKVQPPGKTLSTLSLLSGGEMAFVAIALYFAIIKVRPTPFCIMDEIEAALDEANVDRFAHYLRGMTDRTQFIVITHRRGTMEEADMLYGVTMQEKGVSQVLSVDLEEAERALAK
ncbi:MAG: chromosome segregation protein SMC [Firmicutes bacterium HGW-Firmicutes-16]|nr:MAG: chromosome segregation protein SMC [Firmicutes bacterium HGW-Firmicutes-16]